MPVTLTSNANTNGFLSNDFPHNPPRLYFTAEDDVFDDQTLQEWQDEGFNVAYVPMGKGGKEYRDRLANLSRVGLGVGETYAVIAYGDAASDCLEHYLQHGAANKLCALIAYYPSAIPDTQNTRFASGVRVLVHLVGPTVGVKRTQQLLGIQGKRRTIKRRLNPGIGTGGMLKIAYPTYTYENVEPGFAEHDLDEYERVSAELAWSRTLDVLRRAFRRDVNLEKVWEENVENKFFTRNASAAVKALTAQKTAHLIHNPTLTGGIGADQLSRFEQNLFIPTNPSSLRMRLLSRTIGADRIVDELYMSFKHSQPMPWILPGIPATNKQVEVIVVSIVSIRGGNIYSEHVYWDQASVLLQVGLLDPKLVPGKMKKQGVNQLPIVGREAARGILNGVDEKHLNELVPGWGQAEEQEQIEKEQTMKGKGDITEDEDEDDGPEEEVGTTAEEDEVDEQDDEAAGEEDEANDGGHEGNDGEDEASEEDEDKEARTKQKTSERKEETIGGEQPADRTEKDTSTGDADTTDREGDSNKTQNKRVGEGGKKPGVDGRDKETEAKKQDDETDDK